MEDFFEIIKNIGLGIFVNGIFMIQINFTAEAIPMVIEGILAIILGINGKKFYRR